MDSYLPVQPDILQAAFLDSSPELVEVETQNRGWAEVEFTPKSMRTRWHYVSSVLDRNYAVTTSQPLVCRAGERAFSNT